MRGARCARERIWLTRAQHLAAFGVGVFTFAINYTLVYWAEERVTSAVVAVMFAAMAFLNLIGFRIAFGQRAPPLAWAAASLGIAGVALMSWEEIAAANFGVRSDDRHRADADRRCRGGRRQHLCAARRNGRTPASPRRPAGRWPMARRCWRCLRSVTGKAWAFEPTWDYVLSLLHLAVNGSVIAFVLYYGLARRRGYATASYISALAPPVAMLVSSLFENKVWGLLALGGVVLVLCGQCLLLRVRKRTGLGQRADRRFGAGQQRVVRRVLAELSTLA